MRTIIAAENGVYGADEPNVKVEDLGDGGIRAITLIDEIEVIAIYSKDKPDECQVYIFKLSEREPNEIDKLSTGQPRDTVGSYWIDVDHAAENIGEIVDRYARRVRQLLDSGEKIEKGYDIDKIFNDLAEADDQYFREKLEEMTFRK